MKDRFKAMRKTLGLTQEELASKLGMHFTTISKIERGINNPTEPMVYLLRELYNVNPEWIFEGKEPMLLTKVIKVERKHYSLQDICDAMMKTFETLTEEQKDAVLQYVENLVDTLSKATNDKD